MSQYLRELHHIRTCYASVFEYYSFNRPTITQIHICAQHLFFITAYTNVWIFPKKMLKNETPGKVIYKNIMYMSQNVQKRTLVHVRPAKIQISLRIRAV